MEENKICLVENCETKVYSGEMCGKHYRERLHSGEECSVPGCGNNPRARGYCSKHHKKFMKYGDPLGSREYKVKGKICKIDNCSSPVKALCFCNKHWDRYHKYGNPLYTKYEKHGMSNTTEMTIYKNMINRCYNKNVKAYPSYGGRGITVCDRWKDSFSSFYEDMGHRPSDVHQIDRIDNDLGYNPENCQWLLPVDNVRKRSITKLTLGKAKEIRVLFSTGDKTKAELGRIFGVSDVFIGDIIRNKAWIE